MKRKILEITEIDCGDEICDGCIWLESDPEEAGCTHFFEILFRGHSESRPNPPRASKCLEAERAYFTHVGYSEMAKAYVEGMEKTTIVVTPDKRAQGPPDSIGE